jgi:2,3-bisphosphoglycerate-independent phosphoglycerate mutase
MHREKNLELAPLDELLFVLLRQYKRLLAERGVSLTEPDIQRLTQRVVERAAPDEQAQAACRVLNDLVEESFNVLARWNLSFAQSLQTSMNDLPGWESTSDFLELANQKGNAELRIASGAALLAALGDLRYADVLRVAIAHDPDEIETEVARRVLARSGDSPT